MELDASRCVGQPMRANSGIIRPDQVKERIAAIVSDPPIDLRLDAIDQATTQTFHEARGRSDQSDYRQGELACYWLAADPAFCAYSPPISLKYSFTQASGSSDGACACGYRRRWRAPKDITALARIFTGSLLIATGCGYGDVGQ